MSAKRGAIVEALGLAVYAACVDFLLRVSGYGCTSPTAMPMRRCSSAAAAGHGDPVLLIAGRGCGCGGAMSALLGRVSSQKAATPSPGLRYHRDDEHAGAGAQSEPGGADA